MRWVVLLAVGWLAVFTLFAAALQWSSQYPRHGIRGARTVTGLTRALNNVARGGRMPAWTVTSATSVHHVMVVDVEAERPNEARPIAIQIIEPIRDRYEEVLIYVRRPGTSKEL